MNNKLDAFNNDKVKCKKCKDYYDDKAHPSMICIDCHEKWMIFYLRQAPEIRNTGEHWDEIWSDFINEQT
jgi:hypothetical protein